MKLLSNKITNTGQINPTQRKFVRLYVTILLICFCPSKALGAIASIIFITGMIFYVRHQTMRHIVRYVVFIVIYSAIGTIYALIYNDFSFGNFFFFLITGSSLLIFLYDFRKIVTAPVFNKMARYSLIVLIFEACYGISQGATNVFLHRTMDLSTGDFVRGTIEPFFFRFAGTGSNVMFAMLVSTLLLFFFIVNDRQQFKRKRLQIAFILFAWVMASVVHTLIFFAFAIAFTLIFNAIFAHRKIFKIKRSGAVTIMLSFLAIIVFLSVWLLPRNISNIDNYAQDTLDISPYSRSPKAVATYYSIYELPKKEPMQPLIGLGPGQYSSRAALIRSGEYLKRGAVLPVYTSRYTGIFILPLFTGSGGSTYFPYYSWLTVYGETGWTGMVFAVVLLFVVGIRIVKLKSNIFPYMSFGLLVLIFYVVFLGFQDNYWEWGQSVFPAFLIIRLCAQYLFMEAERKSGRKREKWSSVSSRRQQ